MNHAGEPDCSLLPASLRRLVENVERQERLSPSSARKLLADANVTAADLAPWADFAHPAADSYGRKLVHDGGFFELMVMSWVDGDMAAIHDHGHTQWGAVQVFGPTEHAIFKLDGGDLTTAERRIFAPGTVVAVSHELIHQMGNVGRDPYLTLHLYGSYERESCVTADARLYELDENAVQITCGGVFFSLPEAAVDRREAAPAADFPTTLRFKVELLRRLLRMNGSGERGSLQSPREHRLARELTSAETWQTARAELARRRDGDAARFERYAGIFHQELHAAARLQLELLEAGLTESLSPNRGPRLAELLREDDLSTFADRYLELLGNVFSIDFPSPLAA